MLQKKKTQDDLKKEYWDENILDWWGFTAWPAKLMI
jgi:hypothetical protein